MTMTQEMPLLYRRYLSNQNVLRQAVQLFKESMCLHAGSEPNPIGILVVKNRKYSKHLL